jgi:G2/mitotic-specific cyclin-B3
VKKPLAELLPPPGKVATTVVKSKSEAAQRNASRRISNEFEKTEESLYVSALEEIPSDVSRLSDTRLASQDSQESQDSSSAQESSPESSGEVFDRLPSGVEDFDKENWNDPYQVSNYAAQIFDYLKSRESEYRIKDYMSQQPELSKWMRSLLVDWMVEVQESFELNHETLYLAVKIVDTYLGKERVTKDSLQLLGAAALLIACKYDVSCWGEWRGFPVDSGGSWNSPELTTLFPPLRSGHHHSSTTSCSSATAPTSATSC